jgi:uncharacterized protein
MSSEEIVGLVITLLLMLVGLLGAVLPGLPGTPVVLAAAVIHRLVFAERGASWWVLGLLALLTAFSLVLDFLASTYGAKKLGATWRGAVGAALGAVFGLFWMPFGLLLGPLLGATLFELTAGREWREAGKAGVGAALGVLAGTLGKVACGIAMIALFTLHLLLRAAVK